MPRSLPKALPPTFGVLVDALRPRLEVSHPLKELENIFVSAAACQTTQSFEKDDLNAGLLRARIESRKRASLQH
jgi:hypothetical protein